MAAIPAQALLAGVLTLFQAPSVDGDGLARANAFFNRFVALEQSFDPALSDLYDDDARIFNTRKKPDGRVQTRYVPLPRYRARIKTILPFARRLGDVKVYSDISFEPEENRVRIRATRQSAVQRDKGNISLLVGPNSNGEWRIFEERSDVLSYSPVTVAGKR